MDIATERKLSDLRFEIKELRQKVKSLEGKVEKNSIAVSTIRTGQNTLSKAVKAKLELEEKLMKLGMKPTSFLEAMKKTEAKADYIAQRLQTYIIRECVLTEVSRYVQRLGSADLIVNFHLALMRAYNWNEEFWEQEGAREFTIKEWLDKIMSVEEPAPEEYMKASIATEDA